MGSPSGGGGRGGAASHARRGKRLGWWGVEMAKFLRFCKNMPEGTELRPAMEGYGRYLKGAEPPLQDWQLDQRRGRRCTGPTNTSSNHCYAPLEHFNI